MVLWPVLILIECTREGHWCVVQCIGDIDPCRFQTFPGSLNFEPFFVVFSALAMFMTLPLGKSDLPKAMNTCMYSHNICTWGHGIVDRFAYQPTRDLRFFRTLLMRGDSNSTRRQKPGQVTLAHSSRHRILCSNPRPSHYRHRQLPICSWFSCCSVSKKKRKMNQNENANNSNSIQTVSSCIPPKTSAGSPPL